MQVAIRRCTTDDAPALAALAGRTFQDTFTGTCTEADMHYFLETFYNEGRIRGELQGGADHTFFAVSEEGDPVAYIRFFEARPPYPAADIQRPFELNRLYVDAPYKGKGVAQRLMDFYLECAAAAGCDYLWLGVWEHNYRAQAFYRRYGFSFTGHTHPFPIGGTPQTDEWWALEVKR